jgi:hypothetical protein
MVSFPILRCRWPSPSSATPGPREAEVGEDTIWVGGERWRQHMCSEKVLPANQSKSAKKNTMLGGPFPRWLDTIIVATASCAASREDAHTATAGMRPPRFWSGSMR